MENRLKDKRILFLTVPCDLSNMLFHALEKEVKIEAVIFESKESVSTIVKRRIKKLGLFTVLGQILFQLFVSKALQLFSKARVKEILHTYQLSISAIHHSNIIQVNSLNDKATIELIRKLSPDLILINGTRILSEKLINAVSCKIINVHAGITPQYRGVHGAYWALASGDAEHCGVTVHIVDKGIDTGTVIAQKEITITFKDNFYTYPYIQFAEAIPLLKKAINDHFSGQLNLYKPSSAHSALWYHPTAFRYFYNRIFKNVK